MSKSRFIKGQWIEGKNTIKCQLPIIIFQEDNQTITYCPALDLSGYGADETESNRSFEEVLSEYFTYTVHKKTLAEDLRNMGWTIRKSLKKPAVPPTMEKLLETNEDFSRIFNNHDFRKTHKIFVIPELV